MISLLVIPRKGKQINTNNLPPPLKNVKNAIIVYKSLACRVMRIGKTDADTIVQQSFIPCGFCHDIQSYGRDVVLGIVERVFYTVIIYINNGRINRTCL